MFFGRLSAGRRWAFQLLTAKVSRWTMVGSRRAVRKSEGELDARRSEVRPDTADVEGATPHLAPRVGAATAHALRDRLCCSSPGLTWTGLTLT